MTMKKNTNIYLSINLFLPCLKYTQYKEMFIFSINMTETVRTNRQTYCIVVSG